MAAPELVSESPLPLYHQIAESIRYGIATGRWKEGDFLSPIRKAARDWNVNLHTVRRAYAELAREGLVETRVPHGSRILARRSTSPVGAAGRRAFLRRIVREAGERFGIPAEELAALIAQTSAAAHSRPVVHVVECSEAQCRGHARELEARFDVDARPWPLAPNGAATAEPPPGPVVATYFHYNDVRRRWPTRLAEVRFAAIQPDPALATRLSGLAPRMRRTLVLCEYEAEMAENIAADLAPLFPRKRFEVRTRVVESATQGLRQLAREELALFSPRVWAELSAEERTHPRAFAVEYVFGKGELDALGQELKLRPHEVALARGAS